MLKSDILNICRSCMKLADINIFTTTFENKFPLSYILEKCTQSKVSLDDRLPKNICKDCFDEIRSYYLFVINYEKVQSVLKDIVEGKVKKAEHLTDSAVSQAELIIKEEDCEDDQPLSTFYQNRRPEIVNDKHNSCCKTEHNKIRYSVTRNQVTSAISQSEKGTDVNNILKTNKSALSKHLKAIHKHENYSTIRGQKHSCIICNENFGFIKLLDKHCKDTGHSFPRRFKCDVCLKKFLSKTRLNDHLRSHSNERPHKCHECEMTFTLSSNLKRHKKRHTGEKSYFCEICGRGFIQKHTLSVHMRLHNGETPFVCDICGKGYRAKPLLQQHMYKHKDTEVQTIKYQKYYLKYGKAKVECKVCKKIITKSAMYNHMKVQHGDGLKKFLCNQCGKTYATKMSLDVHMNAHTKKIVYNCTVCSKSFTHQNYLKTHQMLHSGERPHCCDLCGKTFVQKTHLDRHKRTHTGARPYTCSFCDKSFALNENLKVHIRIHTGETPYHCSICTKGFFNSTSKKRHEIKVHQLHPK